MVDRQSLLNEVLANARQQCERARRSEGFAPKLSCVTCDRGPCARGIGESFPPILDVHAWAVPNRLYGATINHEGDAV